MIASSMIALAVGCDFGERASNKPTRIDAEAVPNRQLVGEASSDHSFQRIWDVGLPNAIRVHEKVISGGEPAGEHAFNDLKKLGVRTIISVDGARPNVEIARRLGIRYVHLPHGYNGISDERAKELALAVRTLPGPIYIHCHHGRHRSPAASAVACVASGLIDKAVATTILTVAGTNPNYVGLFASVEKSRKLSDSEWATISSDFPESTKLPPLAEAMVALDHTFESLNKGLVDGPHSVPSSSPSELIHQSLLLNEHFAEMLRLDHVTHESQKFRELLIESEAISRNLLQTMEAWKENPSKNDLLASANPMMNAIATRCTQCHQLSRDLPL
jgi:protein tyrosine phosphatase (PTP) superfamily phosphohydrolase (DUF442 family)